MPVKLFLVDDEPQMGKVFELKFRKEIKSGALDLRFFLDPEEFLKFLKEYDDLEQAVVVSDISMPKLNGIELLKKFKENHPETPFYIVTAFSDQEIKDKASSLGARGVFEKPLDYKAFKEVIKSTP